MLSFALRFTILGEIAGLKYKSPTLLSLPRRIATPDKEIKSIDFIPAQAKAAPFLVGITLE